VATAIPRYETTPPMKIETGEDFHESVPKQRLKPFQQLTSIQHTNISQYAKNKLTHLAEEQE
jgi:hypothetical protein